MGAVFSFDCETTLIDEAHPWITPAYVLGAAFDGSRGVFVTREHLAQFLNTHRQLRIVFHNAAFDLEVLNLAAPEAKVYDAVDQNLIRDTWLPHKLFVLGSEGHTARGKGQATLEHCAEVYLGVQLPKDLKDHQGRANLLRTMAGPPPAGHSAHLSGLFGQGYDCHVSDV